MRGTGRALDEETDDDGEEADALDECGGDDRDAADVMGGRGLAGDGFGGGRRDAADPDPGTDRGDAGPEAGAHETPPPELLRRGGCLDKGECEQMVHGFSLLLSSVPRPRPD